MIYEWWQDYFYWDDITGSEYQTKNMTCWLMHEYQEMILDNKIVNFEDYVYSTNKKWTNPSPIIFIRKPRITMTWLILKYIYMFTSLQNKDYNFPNIVRETQL